MWDLCLNGTQMQIPQHDAQRLAQQPFYPKQELHLGYLQIPIPEVPSHPLVDAYRRQIAFCAVAAIEADIQQNPIRLICFNILAENRYNNQHFAKYLSALYELVAIWGITDNVLQDPNRLAAMIQKLAEEYRKYYSAYLLIDNPYLGTITNQNYIASLQQFVMQFEAERTARISVMQRSQAPQMQYPNNGFGMPNQQGFGMGVPAIPQPNQFGGFQQQPQQFGFQGNQQFGFGNNQPTRSVASFASSTPMAPQSEPRSKFGESVRVQAESRQNTPIAQEQSPQVMRLGMLNEQPIVQQPIFGAVRSSTITAHQHSPATKIEPPRKVTLITKGNSTPNTSTPDPIPQKTIVGVESKEIKIPNGNEVSVWQRSNEYPHQVVCDTSKSSTVFIRRPDGVVQQIIETRDMELNSHMSLLGAPNVKLVHDSSTEDSSRTLGKTLSDDSKFCYFGPNDGKIEVASSTYEHWGILSIQHSVNRKSASPSIPLSVLKGITEEIVVCDSAVDQLLKLIDASDEASKVAASVMSTAKDVKSVVFDSALAIINRRLTDAQRNLVRRRMSLDKGSVTDFIEDAVSVPSFLKREYDEGTSNTYATFEKYEIGNSLVYLPEEKDSNPYGIDTTACPDLKYRRFVEARLYALIDLTSRELGISSVTTGISMLIRKDATPVMEQVASLLFKELKKESNKDVQYIYMRTVEGITYVLNTSVFNNEAYLISRL